ncbi:MAG: hypothetical protein KFF46_09540 [Desulfobacterales bacterium]|nr:hypothetical protein [Desulfobacterales bacterium]
MQDITEKLAQAVLQQLEAGIVLSRQVVHYLESMTGASSARDLEPELEAVDDSELCSLLELIFYPDREGQCAIEPLLEKEQPAEDDINRLQQILCEKDIHTRMIFPDNTMTKAIPVPRDSLLSYVRRLKLSRHIDNQVASAINQHIADRRDVLLARVMLRNSRIAFLPQVALFLCNFFRFMPQKAKDWKACLELAIPLLESATPDTDIYTVLMNQKRHYAEMIRRAENASEQLKQIPVEALIMRGSSIACIGEDEARARMGRIDETALYVFGQTEIDENQGPPLILNF